MKKRTMILRLFAGAAAAGALLVFASACGGGDEPTAGGEDTRETSPLRVVATTVQIEAIAREVGGDALDLRGIIPAGSDAHDFEPVASDLAAIERAQVILRHGIGLDEWLDDTLSSSDGEVVTVTDGIDLRAGEVASAEERDEPSGEGGADGALDPHVWLDPANVKTMVDNIAEAFTSADGENAAAYEANATAYKGRLDAAREEIQAIIDEIPMEKRKLVTNHDAFGYFAAAFGLQIVGAVIPSLSTQSEPSAQDTAELLATIEREGVQVIFAESSVNPALARTLAEDAGIEIVDDLYGDSLGEPGSGAETIEDMLLANARTIADALK